MTKNVGGIDRMIRIVVGAALLTWGITSGNWIGYIGIIPLFTGISGWCPAYCPFNISTCSSCCGGSKQCGEDKSQQPGN